jgi:DNA-binding XRE family transcriptional regulator
MRELTRLNSGYDWKRRGIWMTQPFTAAQNVKYDELRRKYPINVYVRLGLRDMERRLGLPSSPETEIQQFDQWWLPRKRGQRGRPRKLETFLAQTICELSIERSWTVKELAEKLGLRRWGIENLLRSRRPTDEMAARLSAVFDVPVSDILRGTDTEYCENLRILRSQPSRAWMGPKIA